MFSRQNLSVVISLSTKYSIRSLAIYLTSENFLGGFSGEKKIPHPAAASTNIYISLIMFIKTFLQLQIYGEGSDYGTGFK